MGKWHKQLSRLAGLAVILGGAATAVHADVTTDRAGSILVFPKISTAASADTLIQITNTGNSMTFAHCNYVDATLFDVVTQERCSRPSATCVSLWQETDFDIVLTKQQPTQWSVANGRAVNPMDGIGNPESGFDPGRIPPKPDFEGELRCVEIDTAGQPLAGNHLKGTAQLATYESGPDISRYAAIAIEANPDSSPSNPLQLDDEVYSACPSVLRVSHAADGAQDPSSGLSTSTELTLVPCAQDLENQVPKTVTVQFLVFNEYEERFSGSTSVTCYRSAPMSELDTARPGGNSIFSVGVLGSYAALTEITPVISPSGESGGLVGVARRSLPGASAFASLHTEGSHIPPAGADSIFLAERF